MGRIALKCNREQAANEYYTQALSLYETFLPPTDPYFIRLLLDLIITYIKQQKHEQAVQVYERVQNILITNDDMQLSVTLRCWAQEIGCFCQLIIASTKSSQQMLEAYFEVYRQCEYHCVYPVLIGGLAIDIGDFICKNGYSVVGKDCYMFAYRIANQNLPLCHPLNKVSLQRFLKNDSLIDKDILSMIENQLVPLLQHSLGDMNNDDNPIIANTMRDIASEYVKLHMHEKAKSYFEKCIPIYRKQYPRDNVSLNKCQTYLGKQLLPDLNVFKTYSFTTIDDFFYSSLYKYNHPSDPIEAAEQQQLWGMLNSLLTFFIY